LRKVCKDESAQIGYGEKSEMYIYTRDTFGSKKRRLRYNYATASDEQLLIVCPAPVKVALQFGVHSRLRTGILLCFLMQWVSGISARSSQTSLRCPSLAKAGVKLEYSCTFLFCGHLECPMCGFGTCSETRLCWRVTATYTAHIHKVTMRVTVQVSLIQKGFGTAMHTACMHAHCNTVVYPS
jgi:hypothetical protein